MSRFVTWLYSFDENWDEYNADYFEERFDYPYTKVAEEIAKFFDESLNKVVPDRTMWLKHPDHEKPMKVTVEAELTVDYKAFLE
jgi:hypothetical protein